MESAIIDDTSQQFLGQWKRLVSTTNWDKGRIIHQWRQALAARDLPLSEYSDEAWSRAVGSVSPQHVGRLRRVFERFALVRDEYDGLYWSHFQAVLDWNDAEMWLEGAVQNTWSISEMRRQRWQALGAPDELRPREQDIIASEWDEDAELRFDGGEGDLSPLTAAVDVVRRPRGQKDDEEFDASDGSSSEARTSAAYDSDGAEMSNGSAERRAVRPFAQLPSLPSDVSEAFEAYKLCVLRHKLAGFAEISRDDLLATLDALKELVLAPAET